MLYHFLLRKAGSSTARKYFKAGKIVLNLIFLLVAPSLSLGENRNIIPHQIQSGDVISADIFNEILGSISNVTDGFTSPSEIVGTWRYTIMDVHPLSNFLNLYSVDSTGLIYTLTDTINFVDNGDGTYAYSTLQYNIIVETILTTPDVGKWALLPNALLMGSVYDGPSYYTRIHTIQKITVDKFLLNPSYTEALILLERLYTPPAIPTDLTAMDTGLEVTLTWTDNSTDEAGFKVNRKDTLEGEFAEIGTTPADTTTYVDTLTQSGTYWYRVMATNQYGDSLGSNEAMVTVSE